MARTEFTQSARRHRVSKGRARFVVEHPYVVVPRPPKEVGGHEMWMYIGDDHTGRPLEVGAYVKDDGALLVAHAMDLRQKFFPIYEQAKRLR